MTKRPLSKDEKRQERMRKKLYERTKKDIAQGKYFESKREENVIHWCTFFRRNIHRFAINYLGIKLHLFQMIAMYLMNISPTVVLLCARAFSKSFITALWACCVCLLYPNSKIVATALTKKQASLLVKEKIQKELMKMSPRLASHIKEIKTSQNDIEVIFENGSSFICCVCGEQSRGIRSTVLLVDEFRLVDKEVLDSVLVPTEIARPVPYLKLPKWEEYLEILQEEPREVYLSSAYYKSHWMWNLIRQTFKNMYSSRNDESMNGMIICADYELTIHHGIKTKKQMIKAKKQCDDMTWEMEYLNLMSGGAEGQYYTYDLINHSQVLKKAFYPLTLEEYYNSKQPNYNKAERFGYIPKEEDEVRILSMDIAVAKSTSKKKNDFTDIKAIRATRKDDIYIRQEVYSEGHEGVPVIEQALYLKRLYFDFEADWIVLDGRTYGIDLIDQLARPTYDAERETTYPAMKVFNEDTPSAKDLGDRCKDPNAIACIYAFIASNERNHIMHTNMKDALLSGKFKCLKSNLVAKDEYLRGRKEYIFADGREKARLEAPYIYSDMTLNEMISLSRDETKAMITLKEPNTGTKDKYIARAMGNYFITNFLETKLTKKENYNMDDWYKVSLVGGYKQTFRI